MTDTKKKLAFLLATSPHLELVEGRNYEQAADDLIANGVTVQQAKRPRPIPDLTGKCGSCVHAVPAETSYGSTCYVECTLKEHLEKHCNNRDKYTAVRARTTKGCKNYTPYSLKPKEETE